jgi:hypothetical protein
MLPPPVELETIAVLKALARANRALAELKGRAATIPNRRHDRHLGSSGGQAPSEIENIATTHRNCCRLTGSLILHSFGSDKP